MAQHEESELPQYPYIQVDEVMMRLGIDEGVSFYASPAKAREAIGLELKRAEFWLKAKTSRDFTEDVTDNLRSLIADAVTQRVGYFFYQRLGTIRMEVGEHFRILSNRAKEEADRLAKMLIVTQIQAEILTYEDDSPSDITPRMTTIRDEKEAWN